jgi:hypothetical protein
VLSPEGMRQSFRRHQARMKQGPFPRPRLCCPSGYKRYYGPPATLPAGRDFAGSPLIRAIAFRTAHPQTRGQRGLPHPAPTIRAMPIPLPRGFLTAALPGCTRRPWPSPRFPRLPPLSPDGASVTRREDSHHFTAGRLLPPKGLSTLGFDAGRFPPTLPACYQAPWHLPGPNFHRQADASLCSDQIT